MAPTSLHIYLNHPQTLDAEDRARLAGELLQELACVDGCEACCDAGSPAPAGTKGASEVNWGVVTASVISGGGLSGFLAALSTYLQRDRTRSVTLEINGNKLQVSNLSKTEAQALVDWFQTQTGFNLAPHGK